jgi:hypothetical protein
MIRKLLLYIISKLQRLTYEQMTVDNINKKLIRPVDGLIIDGKQYYEFANNADMPFARFMHHEYFRQELVLGLDREQMNKHLEELEKALDENRVSRMGSIIYMLRDTINNCTPLESLYNLASLNYFTKNEDISCYDFDYNNEKIKKFKELPNQAFFLTRLLKKNLKIHGRLLQVDINDYLSKSAVKLKAYKQILSGMGESPS